MTLPPTRSQLLPQIQPSYLSQAPTPPSDQTFKQDSVCVFIKTCMLFTWMYTILFWVEEFYHFCPQMNSRHFMSALPILLSEKETHRAGIFIDTLKN